jgi:hypothetical protein
MYRSPGTSSSPDLATLLKKAKERGGSSANVVGALGRKDKRREGHPPLPDLPYHHTLHHGPVSYTIGDSNPSSPNKNKDGMGTFKVNYLTTSSISSLMPDYQAKTSVRAKTSAFFGKMLGQSTVRERSVCHNSSVFDVLVLIHAENGCVASPEFALFPNERIHATRSCNPY